MWHEETEGQNETPHKVNSAFELKNIQKKTLQCMQNEKVNILVCCLQIIWPIATETAH